MHKLDINIKNLSKIEGHASLNVKLRNGEISECKFKVKENKRFFTKAILGMNYEQVPQIMSRICGTCSSAHVLCSIEAIEKALNIEVSEQTYLMRKLLINAGHTRDHAMHLYFFCLPDLFEKESILKFDEEEHQWIHDGLDIKDSNNFLATIIGGRIIHPPYPTIGGFLKVPKQKEIKEAKEKILSCRKKIIKLIDLFYNDKSDFRRKTNYVGLINEDYNYLKGFIKMSKENLIIPEEKYGEYFEKVIIPYSTATAFKIHGNMFMVGSLSRINLNKENLNKKTKKDAEKYLKIFPSDNIFHNNLAQSIEMLNNIDNSVDILEKLEKSIKEEPIKKPANIKESSGIGVLEAPRGTLYYKLDIDNKGKIKYVNLCIPTQQNLIQLEKDIGEYIKNLIEKNKSKEEITLKVEELIRAYDPCMSCATHFLKINWV